MISLAILAVILLVAVFDIVVGARMLASPAPFLVNGEQTLWSRRAPELWRGDERALLESLYRRLGAFSLHTGVATAVWALMARDQPLMLTVLLGTYTLTGLAFFAGDRKFFAGTRYFVVKQALGALWSLALVLSIGGHFVT